ncbi:hypothetical protein D9623_33925 (plasmid) [Azospirillum brasilense]|uniref:Uncharacterized protein n=1 Tax=Azospirillum brasilense TaxID=192 RepID=A0A4D8QUS4_AZOBR|nr:MULTISPECIES: hypothetical protein [Azospirillum]YP_001686917.1 hypothetical protein APCd_gp76 [Azospirillum phage Cd]MDW7555442.1 hypothetical protein [Azospirillum brasilense]MDW7595150.1 hypothetical protein [Azospirillum brasilense]MDW7630303.1 hypothetical protein [Azospirillum brasilense]MDX5949671.1 hypothetical protein [Azospirillum brasilense]OPH16808.1 hypothetical protein FE89_02275 [Azospirillum brasilense]
MTTDTAPLSAEELAKYIRDTRLVFFSNAARKWTAAAVADALDALSTRVKALEAMLLEATKSLAKTTEVGNGLLATAETLKDRATQAEAERDALWEALDNVIGYASNYLDQHLMVNADKDADIIRARTALAKARSAGLLTTETEGSNG